MPACLHCGHETDRPTCPLCGSEVGAGPGTAAAETPPAAGAPGPEGGLRPPGGADGPGAAAAVPWEDPEVAYPASLWRTLKESLFEPERFFASAARDAPLARPLLYFLTVTIVGAFLSLSWQAVFVAVAGPEAMGPLGGAGRLLAFFVTPFVALFGLVVATLLVHGAVLALAPEARTTRATARVLCYSAGPIVWVAVPLLGPALWIAWSFVLQVLGLRRAHRVNTGRAVLAAAAPMLAFLLVVVLFAALGYVVAPELLREGSTLSP